MRSTSLQNDDMTEVCLSSKTVYEGKIFSIKSDKVSLPSGKESTRDYMVHPGGAAILPVLENGDIILVKQYRHALGRCVLEIPAGKMDKGERHFDTARRELMEETGKDSARMEYLGPIAPSVGCSDEIIHLYVAKELFDSPLMEDEDENLGLITLSPAEIKQKIKDGEIVDAKTVCAFLRYLSDI